MMIVPIHNKLRFSRIDKYNHDYTEKLNFYIKRLNDFSDAEEIKFIFSKLLEMPCQKIIKENYSLMEFFKLHKNILE